MITTQNTYVDFESFLIRHNFSKYKELMRGIVNMNALDKVSSEELKKLTLQKELNPLWEMLADIPFAILKSKICNRYEILNLIKNSNTYKGTITDKEWMFLFYKKWQNNKSFLDHICSDNKNKSQVETYDCEGQNLPWDVAHLKTCTLVTPMNDSVIKELSVALKLCTYENRNKIGPLHQKMIIFNKNKDPIGFLTIYPHYNCFAVSGKNNSTVDSEIEQEIKTHLIQEKLLRNNPYQIKYAYDFKIVNQRNEDYNLESLFENNKELAQTMFPDIEQTIQIYKEKKEQNKEQEDNKKKIELKVLKDLLTAKLSDPDFLIIIQNSLIKKIDQSNTFWELNGIEFLLEDLGKSIETA